MAADVWNEGHTGCKAQVVTGNGNEENLGDLEGERREQMNFGEYRLFLGLGKHSNTLKKLYFPSKLFGLLLCSSDKLPLMSLYQRVEEVMENENFRNVRGNSRNSQE